MLSLGIVEITDVSEEAKEAVYKSVEDAVYAGVTVSLTEWNSMNEIEKACFLEATEKLWRERCSTIGEASHSLISAAYVRSKEEGDDLMAQEAVNLMVNKNIQQLEKEKSTSNK